MGPNFSASEILRDAAQPLVEKYHKHLINLRVPLTFVFSDKETKDTSKHNGYEVHLYINLPGWLAGIPKTEQFFEAYKYVCDNCLNWMPGESIPREIGGKMIGVCEKCSNTINGLDITDAAVISRILGQSVTARKREANGWDEQTGLFVILVHERRWRYWSDEKKLYVLDHCLARCYAAEGKKHGDVKLAKLQYEIQDYSEVLARHSLQVATNASIGGRIADSLKKDLKANLFTQEEQAEEEAITPWSSSVPYAAGQLVFGSDKNTYRSVMSGNLGFDPVDNATYWRSVPIVPETPDNPKGQAFDAFEPTEKESEAGNAADEDDLAALADDTVVTEGEGVTNVKIHRTGGHLSLTDEAKEAEPAFPNKSGRSRRRSGGEPS